VTSSAQLPKINVYAGLRTFSNQIVNHDKDLTVFKHIDLLIFSGTCKKEGARVTSTSKFRHIVLEKLEQILIKNGSQTTSSRAVLTASNIAQFA
jgi:hypothetical protein